jgi:F-type H+-transporting ATPase subunit b
MELLHAFGLDIRIFFAQLINFAVLVFLLHRFAYQPVLKLLEERSIKIEKGLADAKRAAGELTEASAKREEILAETKRESKDILDNALAAAGKIKDTMQKEAEEKAKTIVTQALAQVQEEKKKMIADVKDEVLALAVGIAEKILGEQVTELRNKKYIERLADKDSLSG